MRLKPRTTDQKCILIATKKESIYTQIIHKCILCIEEDADILVARYVGTVYSESVPVQVPVEVPVYNMDDRDSLYATYKDLILQTSR